MGGGDLNLKKSWHPHTMKNQERVWKAEEQAKMEERKLQDLRKEINEERDREELRRLGESSGVLANHGGAAGEAKLEWMYKNSTELINREEYLLGRKIDKSFETLQAEERRQDQQNTVGVKQSINHVEHDCVPFSIREYRNLQSTEQVDMQRKTLEDPLMLIKQREMESRRKLLENPVKLKEIHRILKSEQEKKAAKERKSKKSKKSKKKKKKSSSGSENSDSDSDDDLDQKLARQVSKLKGDSGNGDLKLDKLLDAKYRTISKQLDMATKKKKSKKSKRRHSNSSNESRDDRERSRELEQRKMDTNESTRRRSRSPDDRKQRERRRSRSPYRQRRRSKSPAQRSESSRQRRRSRSPEERRDRRRSRSPEARKERRRSREDRKETHKLREKHRSRSPEPQRREREKDQREDRRERSPLAKRPSVGKPKLSEADREARLREMMDNATWREADRSQVVRKHREAYAREEAQNRDRDFDKEFINKEVKKAIANQNSIGDRIRANLNNIQRTASSMDTNFARK